MYFIENFSQYLQWLVFVFVLFICLQLNSLHKEVATKKKNEKKRVQEN